jgi:hypothetical protein
MKEILRHSFVLDAPETYFDSFSFFESLVLEHKEDPLHSRLKKYIPNIGKFHTELPLRAAFAKYDHKYCITQRQHIPPSFHELRHICNLAQVMALGRSLSMISFDGDQTLYSDGGNFEYNVEMAEQIIELMVSGVKIAVITAAGYGLDGSKYAIRLQGLLQSFVQAGLTKEQISRFYVFGGECNYLLQATLAEVDVLDAPNVGFLHNPASDSSHPATADSSTQEARNVDASFKTRVTRQVVELHPVPLDVYQAPSLTCPKPSQWPIEQVNQILDTAEGVMRESCTLLKLRARVLRKERSVGVFPGGDLMAETVKVGHGGSI